MACDVPLAAHRDPVPHPQPRRGAPQGARGAADRGARQGPHRRAGRDRARPREPRVRVRHPAADQGPVQRAGVVGRRCLPDPPAAGRRGGHHALQLPGDGAHVDVRERHRVRQHVPAQALREGPLRVPVPGGAAPRGGRPGRRVQRHPGRQGRRRRHPRPPRHQGRLVRGIDAHRALHLRDRHRQGQARPGTGWRQEPHGGAARRGREHGRRRRGLRRVWLGGRAMHGHQRRGRGGRRRRSAGRCHQGPAAAHQGRPGHRPDRPRWARS